jgi:tight adherence protein C
MPIQIVLAALAVSISVPLLWFSVASARGGGSMVLGKGQLATGEIRNARDLVLTRSASERIAIPFLRNLGTRLRRVTPLGWVDALRRNLSLAGKYDPQALERALVGKFVLAGVLLAVGLIGPSVGPPAARPVWAIGLSVFGFFIIDLLTYSKGKERQARIEKLLPDTLDQMRMSVDAGLGFEAAMHRAAHAGDGPLAQELRRLLHEIQLGVPRAEAMRNLADRTNVQDLDSFVLAIVQSSSYGIPVANVLRVQSDELRDKRRQRAEEQALKIPVLLIFPLAFCIFPAMFVVLLGPAAIRIFRDLSGAL